MPFAGKVQEGRVMVFIPMELGRHQWGDKEIDDAIEIRHMKCELGKRSAVEDAECLRHVLSEIFVSTPQIREILRELYSYAAAHEFRFFQGALQYQAGLYRQNPWGASELPSVCITGLAGTGKTSIRKAFVRMLSSSIPNIAAGHEASTNPVWPISLSNGTSASALLKPFFRDVLRFGSDDLLKKKKINNDTLFEVARRQSWLQRTCIIWPDEFQNVSYRGESSAKATNILYNLFAIGPRLFYTANYSLLWALTKRYQQDKDRFLSRAIVLTPENIEGQNLFVLLDTYIKNVPYFKFSAEQALPFVDRASYGNKRYIVNLLYNAYLAAREQGRYQVEVNDLHRAYSSNLMAGQRADVEALFSQQVSGSMVRRDLWNPLGEGNLRQSDTKGSGAEIHELTRAKRQFQERIEETFFMNSLLPQNAAALQEINELENGEDSPAKATVTKIRRKRPSKESLIAGVSTYFDKI